ncbi:MAG: ATP-binding cassette domain-containing protein [Chloroflexota bacterium]|nr:ATP-binding cassette domain-containing protein [Chloroflexota bacterium]
MTTPPPPAILVRDLRKTYRVPEREGGVRAATGSLVRRRTREVPAVAGVSFELGAGEMVGFLGPNGAGKTTTLKMLSGLLYPTAGEARVLGHVPWRREREFLRRMTLIMGQRNQLAWDIPVIDSFELNRAIYQIAAADYRQRLGELSELLDLGELMRKPVRNLSLGERMKCEIAGSLLHRPEVLFLDEPTIGLDVTMQRRIRTFIAEYNQRTRSTTLLTSHYMADVEALCPRVLVIHHGRLLYDGDLLGLVTRFSPYKSIVIDLAEPRESSDGRIAALVGSPDWVVGQAPDRLTLRVPRSETAAVTSRLLANLPVLDVIVEEPPIDEVIDLVFAAGPDEAGEAVRP